ncbi:Mis6-domain-containing protein [Spinellus fusiger]|nr:Mis6-domain-containing protein [Spinellus fusiger]
MGFLCSVNESQHEVPEVVSTLHQDNSLHDIPPTYINNSLTENVPVFENSEAVDAALQAEFGTFNSGIPDKNLRKTFKEKFERLFPIITKYGVSEQQLALLLDLIFSRKLVDTQEIKLVQLLLPRDNVQEKHVVQIFGKISGRTYPLALMNRLLKWVITIYDLLESTQQIEMLYPVLFHYLTIEKLRPQLCHLLYYMTKSVHVKPYRIRLLLQLLGDAVVEPELYALIFTFKTYSPDILLPRSIYRSKLIFTHPDPTSREYIQNIWRHWEKIESGETIGLHKPSLKNPGTKRRRKEHFSNKLIPSIITTKAKRNAATIQEISNITEFAENIDRLELPDQLASILDNRILQHILICHPKATTLARISFWLSHTLNDLVKWNNHTRETKERFKQLLGKCLVMTRFTKCHFPVFESFLEEYIATWNGVEFEEEIFELITFIKPTSFKALYTSYLKPLYRLYCVSPIRWKAQLVHCYGELLKNWALLDWHQHVKRRGDDAFINGMDNKIWLFDDLSLEVDYFAMMYEFASHVDQISMMGLVLEEDHCLLQHSSLSFFELVSTLSTSYNLPEIILPEEPFITRHFFSTSPMAVSRTCSIIYQYKLAFEFQYEPSNDWKPIHAVEHLEHFNMFVMDLCNALWRNALFSRSDNVARGFSMPKDIIDELIALCKERGDEMKCIVSITHSTCFVGFSKRFAELKERNLLVQHHKPITTSSLSDLSANGGLSMSFGEYRAEFLEYLYDQGLYGVHDLLYECMSFLIQRRKALDPTYS